MESVFIKTCFFIFIPLAWCDNINIISGINFNQDEYNEKKSVPKYYRDELAIGKDRHLETFMDLVLNSKYFPEEHEIMTEDGYLLLIHRISGSPKNPVRSGKPVVLLLHGLMGGSDIWVVRGPRHDLAYQLVDNGYDVWALNVRGNFYSKRHKVLSDKDKKFWEFSWHEIGIYDLPATIDYILLLTGQSKLSLIGHSMGGTEEIVLLSSRPEYNAKINVAFAWAPVATVTHKFSGLFINFLFRYGYQLEKVLQLFNLYELFPRLSIDQLNTTEFWVKICLNPNLQSFCKRMLNVVLGVKNINVDTSVVLRFWSHYPQGTSLRTILHYGQIVLNRKFAQYDFGSIQNWLKYKNIQPPEYRLENITTPLIIYHGLSDHITNKQDVEAMLSRISTAIAKEVPCKNFGHVDFIGSNSTKKFLYKDVLQILRDYNRDFFKS